MHLTECNPRHICVWAQSNNTWPEPFSSTIALFKNIWDSGHKKLSLRSHSAVVALVMQMFVNCMNTEIKSTPTPAHKLLHTINCAPATVVAEVYFGHENECWSRLTTESCCTYWSNGGGNSSIAVITGTKWWEAKVLKTRSVPVLVCACVMPSSLVWISFTSSTTWENRTDVLGVDSFKKSCLPSQCVNLHLFLTLAPEFWRYCWAQHMHR